MNFHSHRIFKNDDEGRWAELFSFQKLIPTTAREKTLAPSSDLTTGLMQSLGLYDEANCLPK
jgi:hypothetical protein